MLYKTTANHSSGRGLGQTVDWVLILCYVALVVIGWLSIYASIHSSEPSSIFDLSCRSGKQFLWFGISLAANVLILFVINPKVWEVAPPVLYLLVFALLVLVIFVSKGQESNACFPMLVTLFGIVTEVKAVQPEKA